MQTLCLQMKIHVFSLSLSLSLSLSNMFSLNNSKLLTSVFRAMDYEDQIKLGAHNTKWKYRSKDKNNKALYLTLLLSDTSRIKLRLKHRPTSQSINKIETFDVSTGPSKILKAISRSPENKFHMKHVCHTTSCVMYAISFLACSVLSVLR